MYFSGSIKVFALRILKIMRSVSRMYGVFLYNNIHVVVTKINYIIPAYLIGRHVICIQDRTLKLRMTKWVFVGCFKVFGCWSDKDS